MVEINHKTKIKWATTVAGAIATIVYQSAIVEVLASSDTDYNFAISSERNCQQMGAEYQEVYAFETTDFYVNICQKGEVYFYFGEAKQSNRNSIFIPADALNNNRRFQAENGNISYTVVLPFSDRSNVEFGKPEEAILTIERNGRLLSVESSLNKYCQAIALDDLELNSQGFNELAIILQQQDIGGQLSSAKPRNLLPAETFNSDSRFEFYRINGELHRLTTCN